MKTHHYEVSIAWKGNKGQGTRDYKAYSREFLIAAPHKYMQIEASSDLSFLGDKTRYNPEELFLSSIAGCHMLWYLHLCAVEQIVVENYTDTPKAEMEEKQDGSGRFLSATLYPKVVIRQAEAIARAKQLHTIAHQKCFIANSCNFPIDCKAEIAVVS
jgi:organic hydroperoxide reductase OsmC/OhrA